MICLQEHTESGISLLIEDIEKAKSDMKSKRKANSLVGDLGHVIKAPLYCNQIL